MVYLIINWFLSLMGLLGVTLFVPGFRVTDFASAVIAAGLVGLVSALIGLTLRHIGPIAVVFSIALLGVLNTFLFRLSGLLIPGFAMNGFVPAICGAIALAVVNVATLRYAASLQDDFDWDVEPSESAPEQFEQAAEPRFEAKKLVSSHR
ncbi:MAG TPA: phage holin family protein [Bryobacteraceae bacterium]|nr:phage holin family protein [Bryobacteraceae bacterium]